GSYLVDPDDALVVARVEAARADGRIVDAHAEGMIAGARRRPRVLPRGPGRARGRRGADVDRRARDAIVEREGSHRRRSAPDDPDHAIEDRAPHTPLLDADRHRG